MYSATVSERFLAEFWRDRGVDLLAKPRLRRARETAHPAPAAPCENAHGGARTEARTPELKRGVREPEVRS